MKERKKQKNKLKHLIISDMSSGGYNPPNIIKIIKRFVFFPNFRCLIYNRIYNTSNSVILKRIVYVLNLWIDGHYGISIPVETKLGECIGLPHSGPIVINPSTIIGNNVIIHPNVLLGGIRGKGAPCIGNNVFIGNGTKILGNVKIGNNVFIAPNSVVIHDIVDEACVGGNPCKILNFNGKKNVKAYSIFLYEIKS